MVDLSGKRALVIGAESAAGEAVARAVAEAGAAVAVVAAASDAETAFAMKRLARRTGAAASQAIDASNEMAVRVMVRQVSKELGGLDAVVVCSGLPEVVELAARLGAREIARSGQGTFVAVAAEKPASQPPEGVSAFVIDPAGRDPAAFVPEIVAAIAGQ